MGFAAQVFRLIPGNIKLKKQLKFYYFNTVAAFGIVRSPALFRLDRLVEHYLPERAGVFIEAGANDGVTQSNTWYFEKYKGWSGLLIEPLPDLAALAARSRKGPVANVALGATDGGVLELVPSDLTTTADIKRIKPDDKRISVNRRSLSSLLTEHGISKVDFLSLDVEGFEIEVLNGLNLHLHRPRYILVETSDIELVMHSLHGHYHLVRKLSIHDYLLRSTEEDAALKGQ